MAWSLKTSMSWETSSNFDILTHWPTKDFAASPIDAAKARTPDSTQHVGASKRAFRARLPPILTRSCKSQIDVFLRVVIKSRKFATSKSMFHAGLPPNFIISHKMQRQPRHLNFVTTSHSPANAICEKHATRSHALRLPRQMKMDTSKVLRLPRQMQRMFCQHRESIASAKQNGFRHLTKHAHMSRSATPATRNEAT